MNDIPRDFAPVEAYIREARLERSAALAQAFVDAGVAIGRALRSLFRAVGQGLEAERDRRAIEADVFLKRSVPRY